MHRHQPEKSDLFGLGYGSFHDPVVLSGLGIRKDQRPFNMQAAFMELYKRLREGLASKLHGNGLWLLINREYPLIGLPAISNAWETR